MTSLQDKISRFDWWVGAVTKFGEQGSLIHGDDPTFTKFAALAVAHIIDTEYVPVSKDAWFHAQWMLIENEALMPQVLNFMLEKQYLRISDVVIDGVPVLEPSHPIEQLREQIISEGETVATPKRTNMQKAKKTEQK